jgi:hypothetical protein
MMSNEIDICLPDAVYRRSQFRHPAHRHLMDRVYMMQQAEQINGSAALAECGGMFPQQTIVAGATIPPEIPPLGGMWRNGTYKLCPGTL